MFWKGQSISSSCLDHNSQFLLCPTTSQHPCWNAAASSPYPLPQHFCPLYANILPLLGTGSTQPFLFTMLSWQTFLPFLITYHLTLHIQSQCLIPNGDTQLHRARPCEGTWMLPIVSWRTLVLRCITGHKLWLWSLVGCWSLGLLEGNKLKSRWEVSVHESKEKWLQHMGRLQVGKDQKAVKGEQPLAQNQEIIPFPPRKGWSEPCCE